MVRDRAGSARVSEYWDWIAVSLFLLVTVDLLTTILAAGTRGVAAESNPLVRWALGRGLPTLVAMNLAAVVLAVGFFYALLELLKQSPRRYRRPLALVVEVYIGVLLFVGLAVLANNLAVIVYGSSLLSI